MHVCVSVCVRGAGQRGGEGTGKEGGYRTHVVRGDAAFLLLPHSLTHSLVSFPLGRGAGVTIQDRSVTIVGAAATTTTRDDRTLITDSELMGKYVSIWRFPFLLLAAATCQAHNGKGNKGYWMDRYLSKTEFPPFSSSFLGTAPGMRQPTYMRVQGFESQKFVYVPGRLLLDPQIVSLPAHC